MFVTHFVVNGLNNVYDTWFWAWIMGYIVLDDIIIDVNYCNFNQKVFKKYQSQVITIYYNWNMKLHKLNISTKEVGIILQVFISLRSTYFFQMTILLVGSKTK